MDFPNHAVPDKLDKLFQTINREQVPQKANRAFLRLHGFKSSNDDQIPKMLRLLGFTDGSNTPTEIWRRYHGSASKNVMAEAVQYAYQDLFSNLSNPHERRDYELANYFKYSTGFDEVKVRSLINTFRKLCSFADFSDNTTQGFDLDEGENNTNGDDKPKKIVNHNLGKYSINLNIQLHLPETTNSDVYDKLFESMKKHLIA